MRGGSGLAKLDAAHKMAHGVSAQDFMKNASWKGFNESAFKHIMKDMEQFHVSSFAPSFAPHDTGPRAARPHD